MRFMMLVIPKGYETAKPGTMPEVDAVARMMKYNEELQKAGVLLALDGLHRREFPRAAALTRNARQSALFLARAAASP